MQYFLLFSSASIFFFNHLSHIFFQCFSASRGLSQQDSGEGEERKDLCQPRPVRLCSRRKHLWSIRATITGFQKWSSLRWNAHVLLKLYAGNFWVHMYSCYCANQFCKLCRTWLKRYCLARKRQYMDDRKRIRSLSVLSFFSCRERRLPRGKFSIQMYFSHWKIQPLGGIMVIK